jgi:hypothetical protein
MAVQEPTSDPHSASRIAALRNRSACCSEGLGVAGLLTLVAGAALLCAVKLWLYSSKWEDGKIITIHRDNQIPVWTMVGCCGTAGILSAGLHRSFGFKGNHRGLRCAHLVGTTLFLSLALFASLFFIAARPIEGNAYAFDKRAHDWALGIAGTAITIGGITAAIGLIGYLGLRNRKKAEAT